MSIFSRLFQRRASLNFEGFIDRHCHILPGVDDGVQTMDDALEILRLYEDAGIAEVWLTPHIMEDVPNTPGYLTERYEELQENYFGSIKIHLSAENMIDNLFLQRLDDNDLLPMGNDGRTLMVETSYFNAPMKFLEAIDKVKSRGYYPLLAHPERYCYIESVDSYKELKNRGVKFQLNLMSLCGYYGPAVQTKALDLLREGMYDCMGSDLHRKEHFEIMTSLKLPVSIHDRLYALNKPLS